MESLKRKQGGVDDVAGCFYVGRGSLVVIITTTTVGIRFQRHCYWTARVLNLLLARVGLGFESVVVSGLAKSEADESMMVEVCGIFLDVFSRCSGARSLAVRR